MRSPADLDAAIPVLSDFVAQHPRLFVLTGAGCSTGSGIPDYRDAAGAWKRSRPVQYRDFVAKHEVRQRYWARSLVGWRAFSGARPNAAHFALAHLQERGHVHQLVTQNVDGLHQQAGSTKVIDLHGRLDTVVCLGCQQRRPRRELQAELLAHNPSWRDRWARSAPDGDAEVDDIDMEGFHVPTCSSCGGILKPDVVFFGEPVPRERVALAYRRLEEADAMVVIGSSLMVYSGYRYCLHAAELGIPIAAINLGQTRADALIALKVEARCDSVLTELSRRLVTRSEVH